MKSILQSEGIEYLGQGQFCPKMIPENSSRGPKTLAEGRADVQQRQGEDYEEAEGEKTEEKSVGTLAKWT